MSRKLSEPADEENSSFELPDSTLEVKSGFESGAREQKTAEGHHRFRRRDKKDVPQEPLAERISRRGRGN